MTQHVKKLQLNYFILPIFNFQIHCFNALGETCYLYEPEFETLPPNIQELLRELQQEFDEGKKCFTITITFYWLRHIVCNIDI